MEFMKTLSMRRKAVYEQGIIPFEEYDEENFTIQELISRLKDAFAPYLEGDSTYYVPLEVVDTIESILRVIKKKHSTHISTSLNDNYFKALENCYGFSVVKNIPISQIFVLDMGKMYVAVGGFYAFKKHYGIFEEEFIKFLQDNHYEVDYLFNVVKWYWS